MNTPTEPPATAKADIKANQHAHQLLPPDFRDGLQQAEIAALEALRGQVSHAFVTGAGGFLGKAICKRLLAFGIKVTGFARSAYPAMSKMGVNMIQGDIADANAVHQAMKGCDIVFHVASKAGVWGSKQSYFRPNVAGTENIIATCRALSVRYLVYTSTPSVTFAGEDEENIDESAPYASKFLNYYGESKALAEQLTLDANGPSLKTLALRPHLIWGPEDPHLIPRVIERAKLGKLKLVGKDDKLVDTIYIDNAAYAHILAAVALTQPQSKTAGKAYYLSNDEPITMAAMLNKILSAASLPPVSKRVPASLAYVVGAVLEWVYGVLGKEQEPIMTRFVARQLSTSHYFNIHAAKQDFDYRPLVSINDGMKRLQDWLASQADD